MPSRVPLALLLVLAFGLAGCSAGSDLMDRDGPSDASHPRIEPGKGRIYGTVTDAADDALADVLVTVQYHPEFRARTSDQGQFVLLNLQPFNYTLWFNHTWFEPVERTVRVLADEISFVNVRMAHERDPFAGLASVHPTGTSP